MGRSEKDKARIPGNWITTDETLELLGFTGKSLSNYVKRKLIRCRRFPGSIRYNRSDVLALAKIREGGSPILRGVKHWSDSIDLLVLRINSIEQRLDYLMRVMELDVSVLRDAPDSVLLDIYDETVDLLDMDLSQYLPDQFWQWGTVFCQITELEFHRLRPLTQDTDCWVAFYRLCVKMMTTLRQHRGFEHSPKQQQAYRLLDRGRKRINESALAYDRSFPHPQRTTYNRTYTLKDLPEDVLDRFIAADPIVASPK